MQDSLSILNKDKIVACASPSLLSSTSADSSHLADILSLQSPTTGSFAGDEWGEMDSRFSYCAVSALSLLGRLDALDKEKTVDFVRRCRNFDGGFGMVEGAESHAAYGTSSRKREKTRN